MSTQKDNELNEQELWDLLKDHEETPTRKKVQEEPKPKTVITEKRKKALVWYMVGLFGIAFVVVLISLFLNGGGNKNPGNEPSPEQIAQIQELNDRINQLEEENATLAAEKNALSKEKEALEQDVLDLQVMMDSLNLMIDEMSNSLEYVEGSQYVDADSEQIARKMSAYEALVKAQAAFIDYDEEALNAAMDVLAENLDLLSQDAINAYYMVIEYMEQPYLGQE